MDGIRVIANNKKVRHEYFIEDTFECGIVLTGTEIKSIRQGKVSLKESYCGVTEGEIFVHQMNISSYEQGNIYNVDPVRTRKLLMHKRQISKLAGQVQKQGYSIIPLRIYLKAGKAKIEICLAKGKKLHDKRHTIAARDADRRMKRAMRDH
jgi:SsrA-binding protein